MVFVSHASEDKDRFVLPFATMLRGNGVDAWVDRWEILPGDSLIDRIFDEGIGRADAVIVVLSRHSVDKKWVREELEAAAVRRIAGKTRLIVIRLDQVDIPDPLQHLVWIDIDSDKDYSVQLDQILKAVFEVHERPPLGPIPAFASQPMSVHAPDSIITQLKWNLSDPQQKTAVHDIIHTATTRVLSALAESRYPISMIDLTDSAVPAALEERLNSYEHDMEHLLRLVATGVYFGNNRHDELWIRAVNRVLNRRDKLPSSFQQHWLAAEAYPALLLTYAIGIASMAAGLDAIIYRQLTRTKTRTSTRVEQPALRALVLYRVVDPKYASAFPKWDGVRYYHTLSVHLRQVLRPIFSDLLDDHEYATAFEEYEYLRSLLEFHYAAFASPLGEFAYYLDKGRTTVHQRMRTRLTANSALLQAGAFDGETTNVDKARRQLNDSIRGRYL